jgi:hypothetical protein
MAGSSRDPQAAATVEAATLVAEVYQPTGWCLWFLRPRNDLDESMSLTLRTKRNFVPANGTFNNARQHGLDGEPSFHSDIF